MNVNSLKPNNHTIGEWLKLNSKKLEAAGIRSARLDCLILLEQRLPANRARMLAHLDDIITDDVLQKLNSDIQLRLQHKPVQYITGFSEFYGRQFIVSGAVLVPRPESEDIISLLKKLQPEPATILDIGTGSGCLAITAKLELPHATVVGLDIDNTCIAIARQNASKLGAEVSFLQSDLLDSLSPEQYPQPTVLLANLPYVPNDYHINKPAKHEPAHALFGGQDGLDVYRKLWKQIDQASQKPSKIICESLTSQHDTLLEIAQKHGYSLYVSQGLQQLFEVN